MRIIAIVMLLAAVPLVAQSPAAYQITHTYTLGGDGGWDYIVPDPPNHRLFIGRQNRVMVVDENTGMLLGEVTGIQGAHGTAIATASGHGFATSGNDQSVVMFDLKTFAVLGRIPAAEDADAIIYDPASNRVFSFNGDAHSSTVIDPGPGTVITNIPLGGKPEYGAAAGDGKVYANLTDTSAVVEIDARTATVVRRWPTAPCAQPVAMAIDTARHRLFSGCRSGVMAVSDYQAGKVVATVPIGAGVDGAGYDATSGDAFASNADGTLTVIHQDDPDRYHVVESVQTAVGSRNLGLDPTTHRLYIASATFGPAPASGRGRGPVLPGSFAVLVIERVPVAVAAAASKPTRGFFPALGHNLGDDVKHMPRVNSVYWLAGGGGLALAVHPVDKDINAHFVNSTTDKLWTPGHIIGSTPVILGSSFTTYLIGRTRHMPRLQHLGMDEIEATILAEGVTQGLKLAVRRDRPVQVDGNQSNTYSFPSGHAMLTFATATVLQQHLGYKAAIPTYAVASYVAMSRLHDNRHYASDVIFGAALGVVIGRSVTWHGRNFYASPMLLHDGGGLQLALAH